MAAVDGMSSKNSTLGSVWETKVSSTSKPRRATRTPERSARFSDQLP